DEPEGQAPHDEAGRDPERWPRPEGAGGDRPQALLRVQAVLGAVGDVVEEVDGAGEGAEEGERGERGPDERRQELLGEDQAREDEEVLRPLARAQRHEDGSQSRFAIWTMVASLSFC